MLSFNSSLYFFQSPKLYIFNSLISLLRIHSILTHTLSFRNFFSGIFILFPRFQCHTLKLVSLLTFIIVSFLVFLQIVLSIVPHVLERMNFCFHVYMFIITDFRSQIINFLGAILILCPSHIS